MKYLKYFLLTIGIIAVSTISFMKISGMNITDIALKTLGLIKKVKGNSVNISKLNIKNTDIVSHETWTALLQEHVNEEGKVNYSGFQEDIIPFNSYLTLLSDNIPGDNWSDNDKIAYWINVYNAFTVKLILDHFPLKSIKDISAGLPMINSPWDIKFFKIGNVDFDLNTVEHEILRKEFDEPRIHFAINCASFSCPKLRTEAFESDQLENQLNDQAKAFILNSDKNKITESQSSLSKIFSWFESDFTSSGGVSTFIKKYHPDFNHQNKIRYLDYDWSLN